MAYKNDGKHITQRNLFMVIAFNTWIFKCWGKLVAHFKQSNSQRKKKRGFIVIYFTLLFTLKKCTFSPRWFINSLMYSTSQNVLAAPYSRRKEGKKAGK